ncbi:hypothetical protein [Tumebacillus permanentifrigoris]|uniref:Uncharacterized protein n=1 Tax=Tumebacillus permanentifrigoris TaxID=378543 RepID=A0A316D7I0_9BACL|nr:hypothetical protein [Tumebacillus permanentifrigoris]PWK11259.1 hypothetical protein C7459_11152 [Tumebacillus permanentifrigoris]
MRFSRSELIEIITPHVLRTLVRLQASSGNTLSEQDLIDAGLAEEQRRALVQTKRLLETGEMGVYSVNL